MTAATLEMKETVAMLCRDLMLMREQRESDHKELIGQVNLLKEEVDQLKKENVNLKHSVDKRNKQKGDY